MPPVAKADGHIDWTRSAQAIHNQIRAMVPWPKSFTHHLTGEGLPLRLIIESSAVFSATMFSQLPSFGPCRSRRVPCLSRSAIASSFRLVRVFCGSLQLQPAGKKVLSADAFLRGYRVKAGDYFGPLAEPSSDR